MRELTKELWHTKPEYETDNIFVFDEVDNNIFIQQNCHRKRRSITTEKTITWTRSEIKELIQTFKGEKYFINRREVTVNSNKGAKAKFLQKVSEKWRAVPYVYVERWLSEMGDHINRTREQFIRKYESYDDDDEDIVYSSQTTDSQSIDSNSIIFNLKGTVVGLKRDQAIN